MQGTDSGGVFKSTNAGNSWTAINTGLNDSAKVVLALALDPETPNMVYAGTLGGSTSVLSQAPK